MKAIQYPVESFFWNLHDELGNSKVEIRDAVRNTVFFMSIKGHEYYEEKHLLEELAPLVVNLMNLGAEKMKSNMDRPPEFSAPAPPPAVSNGKPAARRGNPKWVKGYKKK